MANRVCIGDRGGQNMGVWISKPGFNVLSADSQDLMFDMNLVPFRITQQGEFYHRANDGFSYNLPIYFPTIGYTPIILVSSINTDDPNYWLDDAQVTLSNISESSCVLNWFSWGQFGETYKYAHKLIYHVTNIPLVI